MKTTTIVAASVGTAITVFAAYALYFDHRRRTDPEFRKALRKEGKRQARLAREEAEAQSAQQREAIRAAYKAAKEEGFPSGTDQRESLFLSAVSEGEALANDGSSVIESAACFYRALKVYPQQEDLMNIYDKTVPKPVLDVLAEIIAMDPDLLVGRSRGRTSSDNGAVE